MARPTAQLRDTPPAWAVRCCPTPSSSPRSPAPAPAPAHRDRGREHREGSARRWGSLSRRHLAPEHERLRPHPDQRASTASQPDQQASLRPDRAHRRLRHGLTRPGRVNHRPLRTLTTGRTGGRVAGHVGPGAVPCGGHVTGADGLNSPTWAALRIPPVPVPQTVSRSPRRRPNCSRTARHSETPPARPPSHLAELPEPEHRRGIQAVLVSTDVIVNRCVLFRLPDRQYGNIMSHDVLDLTEVVTRLGAVPLGG